ncbi:MAG: sodium:proton antiporter NhaD [Gammaproteobacteria bacterium]|jgi:Na+/H+ antiporter NhaD/arsenite permease-like protein
MRLFHPLLALVLTLAPGPVLAAGGGGAVMDLIFHPVGYLCLAIFVVAYALVISEEWIKMRKSIPVLLAAGFIWTLIGFTYAQNGDYTTVSGSVRHSLLEYAELLLFLLVAMTYINTLEERGLFHALRAWLVSRGFTLRTIYWLTGVIAFFMSPLADNMTTALVLASVAIAVGAGHRSFVAIACINIVVAANAGGAWSPFGDITTLMVWQKGLLTPREFLALLLPSVVNWVIPAAIMSFAVPKATPQPLSEAIEVKRGGFIIVGMFVATVALTVSLHSFMHLPPVLGMMGGLGLLKFYGTFLRQVEKRIEHADHTDRPLQGQPFNVFEQVARAEWDTLLFFYGIIMCVGGLAMIGYLSLLSGYMYGELGASTANVLVGVLSAVIDNIPVMFAVLTMNPVMTDGQWLLVTLTAGVGGSLLSIGSAAGVAVMGIARGQYTFFSHLRWTWAIALGYAASIAVHFWLNQDFFAAGCC